MKQGIDNHEIEMSPVQQAYWVGRSSGLDLDGVSTHTCEEIDCRDIDLPRLERTFNQLIKRHDMLRGRINSKGKIEIHPEVPYYRFPIDDIRGCTTIDQHKRLEHLRNRMFQEVLASDSWPLYRIKAVHLENGRHRLFISTDALILDASSRSVLFREWRDLYEDEEATLPEIGGSFSEFMNEVNTDPERLAKKRQAESYWSDRVPSMPGPPRLEALRTNRTNDDFGRIETDLTPELFSRICERCDDLPEKVSLTSFFLAAFARTIARWSKEPEFHIILTLFDQSAQQDRYKNTLGDFTNTMLVDCTNDPESPISDAAVRVHREIKTSIRHSAHDGVEVMREIMARRSELSRTWPEDGVATVFTSVLGSRHKNEWRSAWIGDLVNMQTQTPQVGLDFQLWKVKGTVRITWDYARSILDPTILQGLFDDYVAELKDSCTEIRKPEVAPERNIRTPARRSESVMTDGISWHVNNRPDSTAIQCAKRVTTFGQLGERAMGVAEAIRRKDPEGATPVILAVGRSEDQAIGALGIMLAGRPYVPVNVDWPSDRIRGIADLCDARCIVCHGEEILRDELGEMARIDPAEVSPAPFDDAKWPNHPDDLAYIIFTSGSTGEPKGVAIAHRGASNTCRDLNGRWGVGAGDAVLGLASLSFDLSVFDLFGVLAGGGRLVLPAPGAPDPEAWLASLEAQQVTVWNTAPP